MIPENALKLQAPSNGQSLVIIPSEENTLLNLYFSLDNVLIEKTNESLVFVFGNGGQIILENFYNIYSQANLPEFIVDDTQVTGEEFFAFLDDTLMPAAGPDAGTSGDSTAGGRFSETTNAELATGVDALDGVDGGSSYDRPAFSTPTALDTTFIADAGGVAPSVPPSSPSTPNTPDTPSEEIKPNIPENGKNEEDSKEDPKNPTQPAQPETPPTQVLDDYTFAVRNNQTGVEPTPDVPQNYNFIFLVDSSSSMSASGTGVGMNLDKWLSLFQDKSPNQILAESLVKFMGDIDNYTANGSDFTITLLFDSSNKQATLTDFNEFKSWSVNEWETYIANNTGTDERFAQSFDRASEMINGKIQSEINPDYVNKVILVTDGSLSLYSRYIEGSNLYVLSDTVKAKMASMPQGTEFASVIIGGYDESNSSLLGKNAHLFSFEALLEAALDKDANFIAYKNGFSNKLASDREILFNYIANEIYSQDGADYELAVWLSNMLGGNIRDWYHDNGYASDGADTTKIYSAVIFELLFGKEGYVPVNNAQDFLNKFTPDIIAGAGIEYKHYANIFGSDNSDFVIGGVDFSEVPGFIAKLLGIEASALTSEDIAGFINNFEQYMDKLDDISKDLSDTNSSILVGADGNDIVIGSSGNDLIMGGASADAIKSLALELGLSQEVANILAKNEASKETAQATGDFITKLLAQDNLDNLADIVNAKTFETAKDGNNVLYGGAGNDLIIGGAGNDTIYAGSGNDIIFGGSGNDTIWLGSGNNVVWGGDGKDTFAWNVEGLGGTDTIKDAKAGEDVLDLSSLKEDYSFEVSHENNNTHITVTDDNSHVVQTIILENITLDDTSFHDQLHNSGFIII